jgi:nitrogen fixation/metabolism regulation signal transduction histidine kinase
MLIAAGTSVYIIRKYDADKNKTILSRLNAMWFAITDHFNAGNGLSHEQKNQWTSGLNDIVSNFNFDFNLYDENGNLFYSSQPKLFEKGILSDRINPEAFYEMRLYGKTQFVHTESIGTLNYASAYAPFTGDDGNIAGYLNLPYFEKQNELNKEISGFLSALINIYLLLLVASLLLALFITSRITKPLLLIQERLREVKLGSRNEVIEWKRNDEIGQLVRQYNTMVEALAESAEKLTRSERESAWREMAQQVAHEIKNPLTPMKLSVQHLQRAWKDKSGNLEELFQRISQTLIEQIDTLSTIASAFSDFARMPKAKNEHLSLSEVLTSSINVFNDTPDVKIIFNDDGQMHFVLADREQLIRAFSNIIKNAIQSIPPHRNGLITISVNTGNDAHIISFADNGSGIPGALVPKIFAPSFTTKSSGMGLGLAIVKSTIDAAMGSIWFETKEGDGTIFYISLPIAASSQYQYQ